MNNESITLSRDIEAAVIPIGTKVTLQKGEQAYITQSLGGSYTVVVSNNGGVATSVAATLTVNYSLTVTTSSGGSVTIQPNQNSYAPGTSVTLKATPSLLYKFTGWSGNATGTANPLTITMNGNKQIKANFALLGLLPFP